MKTKKVKFKNKVNIKNNKKKLLTKKLKNKIKEKLKIKLKPIIEKHLKKYTKKTAQRNKFKKNKFRKSKKKFLQKGGMSLADTFQTTTDLAKGFYDATFIDNIAGVVAEVALVPLTEGSAGAIASGGAEEAATAATPPPGDIAGESENLTEASICGTAEQIVKDTGSATAMFGAAALGAVAGGTLNSVIGHDQARKSATDMYNENKKKTNESGASANDSANETKRPSKDGTDPNQFPNNTTPGAPFVPGPTPDPYN